VLARDVPPVGWPAAYPPALVADRMGFDAVWRGVEYAARLARRLVEPTG
jgi:hypothetical protein